MAHITYREDSQPTIDGPADYFTGKVHVQTIFPANEVALYSSAYVTFDPGARTAWRTHPAGQHFVVTDGIPRAQSWGGPIETINKGEAVWFPPGLKHWHGATPDAAKTHLVVTGSLDGERVDWLEKVTDTQYSNR